METIRIGGLELEVLQDNDGTQGSLDIFRMTVLPNAKVCRRKQCVLRLRLFGIAPWAALYRKRD